MAYKEGPNVATDLSKIKKENLEIADDTKPTSIPTDVCTNTNTNASSSQINEGNVNNKTSKYVFVINTFLQLKIRTVLKKT